MRMNGQAQIILLLYKLQVKRGRPWHGPAGSEGSFTTMQATYIQKHIGYGIQKQYWPLYMISGWLLCLLCIACYANAVKAASAWEAYSSHTYWSGRTLTACVVIGSVFSQLYNNNTQLCCFLLVATHILKSTVIALKVMGACLVPSNDMYPVKSITAAFCDSDLLWPDVSGLYLAQHCTFSSTEHRGRHWECGSGFGAALLYN